MYHCSHADCNTQILLGFKQPALFVPSMSSSRGAILINSVGHISEPVSRYFSDISRPQNSARVGYLVSMPYLFLGTIVKLSFSQTWSSIQSLTHTGFSVKSNNFDSKLDQENSHKNPTRISAKTISLIISNLQVFLSQLSPIKQKSGRCDISFLSYHAIRKEYSDQVVQRTLRLMSKTQNLIKLGPRGMTRNCWHQPWTSPISTACPSFQLLGRP